MLAKISATMLIGSARSGSSVLTRSMMPGDSQRQAPHVQAGESETLSAFQPGGRSYRQGPGRDRERHQDFEAPPLHIWAAKAMSAVRPQWH
jgi:hypothetical protein